MTSGPPLQPQAPPTEVVPEAYGGLHHWGRVLRKFGHRARLIPPQYVMLFVKRAKNDRNDAEAISEAASRPTMASVTVKTTDQQADAQRNIPPAASNGWAKSAKRTHDRIRT